MDRVDDMSQDIVKFNTYSRNLTKQQQQKHQVPVVHTYTKVFMDWSAHTTYRHNEQATLTPSRQHLYKEREATRTYS